MKNGIKMLKKIVNLIVNIAKLTLKIAIFLPLLVFFAVDFFIAFSITEYSFIIYGIVMVICLISFAATFFASIRKVSYIIFAISFIIYLLMFFYYPPIVERHAIDRCFDSGSGVWDYNEHRCRADCWKWDKEHGCYKIELNSL